MVSEVLKSLAFGYGLTFRELGEYEHEVEIVGSHLSKIYGSGDRHIYRVLSLRFGALIPTSKIRGYWSTDLVCRCFSLCWETKVAMMDMSE